MLAAVAYHGRVVFSCLLLIFCCGVVGSAIFMGKTDFFSVPAWAQLLLLLVCLFLLGVVEGLQIALVELKKQDPEMYRVSHPRAFATGCLASRGETCESFP